MSAQSDVSVITLVKNRVPEFHRLVRQLEATRVKPRELIVVWMTSPSSHSLVQSDHFAIKHKFTTTSALPIAQARNRGAQASEANNLVFTDVDCVPHPELFSLLTEAPTRGVIQTTGFTEMTVMSRNACYSELSALAAKGNNQHVTTPSRGTFNSALFSLNRQDFMQLGGFDEGFYGFGIGDIDFATRCAKRGMQIKTRPVVTFKQYRHCRRCPLNHLLDIVANANRYREKWGYYPETAWLTAFMAQGFVSKARANAPLTVTRLPSEKEIRDILTSRESISENTSGTPRKMA
ncbi:galactosyltransferase-related protein [Alteromonas sp. ASW11-19]|uniref:Galactosyltransferase-related protein n=1 Tax=Alteromonas salexigens TaxID=2982530 RepID=A0ABT2VPE3_9ALTE|nr:galactosyltransferase-related protein [Alteromonas salexigens]MCU7553799.1 galactosyltransferase-related protein [Alteromonas salexigens]